MKRDRLARLLIWGCISIIIGLFLLCMHPYTLKSDLHRTSGAPISLDASCDVLIVVDYSTFEPNPAGFSDMSFSLSWLNTFQQEIGPVSLFDSKEFESAELSQYRILVLTQSASWNDAWIPRVRNFLEKGGTVVLEMPAGGLRGLASADGKGGERTTQNITYVSGVQSSDQQLFSELNLSNLTRLVGSAGPLDEAQTWMTIDGVPVIYSKPYALGTIITVDFDYGMLMTALHQGRPLEDFSIRNLNDSSHIETSDLAQTTSIDKPIADMLERVFIYGILNEAVPVVTFWPYFDGLAGAMIVTHREEMDGDSALWMPEYESTFKATSTAFISVPPVISEAGMERMKRMHTEAALAFELEVAQKSKAREPIGLFKISPIWRQLSIEEQAASLKSHLDENTPLLSSQSREGRWTSHYTHGFEMISTAGIRADASYRAALETPGYAFHSGIPFLPLDTNGLVFNILEFPVIFPELSSKTASSKLDQFLSESEQTQHEVITVSFEPGLYLKVPDVEIYQTWKMAYDLANRHRHWITGILNYFRFSRARFTAELNSKTIEMQIGHKKSSILRIEILAPENGMSITVPKTLKAHQFFEARRGVQRVSEDTILNDAVQATPVSISGFNRMLIPLNRGFNAIDVIYE